MDAGEWTKDEPRQDGGPEGGWPLPIGDLGRSLTFWGVTLATKSEARSLGVHLDQAVTMETQVALVPPISRCGRLPSCIPILMVGHSPLWSMRF